MEYPNNDQFLLAYVAGEVVEVDTCCAPHGGQHVALAGPCGVVEAKACAAVGTVDKQLGVGRELVAKAAVAAVQLVAGQQRSDKAANARVGVNFAHLCGTGHTADCGSDIDLGTQVDIADHRQAACGMPCGQALDGHRAVGLEAAGAVDDHQIVAAQAVDVAGQRIVIDVRHRTHRARRHEECFLRGNVEGHEGVVGYAGAVVRASHDGVLDARAQVANATDVGNYSARAVYSRAESRGDKSGTLIDLEYTAGHQRAVELRYPVEYLVALGGRAIGRQFRRDIHIFLAGIERKEGGEESDRQQALEEETLHVELGKLVVKKKMNSNEG